MNGLFGLYRSVEVHVTLQATTEIKRTNYKCQSKKLCQQVIHNNACMVTLNLLGIKEPTLGLKTELAQGRLGERTVLPLKRVNEPFHVNTPSGVPPAAQEEV